MNSGKSSDPLQAYIDDLLLDNLLSDALLSPPSLVADDTTLKLAAGSNIATLASAQRPSRSAPARPYAEPIRTLNLRMPLPPVAPPVTTPVVEVAPVATIVETELRVATELPLETKPIDIKSREVVVQTALVETQIIAEPQPIAELHDSTDFATMVPPPAWLANGRPQWAQQPFECLLFKAGGLQLAAPLVELGSIYPVAQDGLTAIFGQTHWFMGLLPVKEYNVRAMDTALVVMPERYHAAMRENYRFIVTLFGSDWGLAVDAVVGTVLLDPEHIRWRGERSKRPWLAGTLIDQMCALFDISQLAWLFHNQDRKRTPA